MEFENGKMKKSLIALAFGTLGLGIAEFVMMGILPDVAADFAVGIPEAGHLISAYAVGVCVGAPGLILARRYPLKNILLLLVAMIAFGNALAALSPGFGTMTVARFVSGLPHGAYFGVASIVASKIASEGRSSEAVAVMIAGMTVANLFGVPAGTFLAGVLSWRVIFAGVVAWSLLTFYFVRRWVPDVGKLPDAGFRGQFRFLRSPAPWLLLAAVVMGNGGIFCWYSYVSPMLTEVAGFPAGSVTWLMVLAGSGMVVGNLVGGRLSDRYTPGRVAAFMQGAASAVLLSLFFLSGIPWLAASLMFLCTACLFAISSPQQVLIIRQSRGGELLGAAGVQVAFNLGNALGAYCGGLSLSAGYDCRYPALVGVPFALTGFVLLSVFCRRYE